MGIACGVALAALALLAAPSEAGARAVLVLVPAASDDRLLERFERLGAVGATSPAVGGYDPAQMFLDVGQGGRISGRTYKDPLPQLRLRRDGSLEGWREVVERARDAPGEVVPGLLGETVRGAGGRTAYAGLRGLSHQEAAAAADREGHVDTVALGPPAGFGARLERLASTHELVVARLPASGSDAILARLAGTDALVIAVRAPRPGPLVLLPTVVAPGEGVLTSRTTRRHGMVAAPDYAPTILDRLGLDAPGAMQGHPLETESGTAGEVASLVERLAQVSGRRGPVLRLAFASWIAILGGLALAGRPRQGLRLPLLAALWLPGVALVAGGLAPSRTVEVILLPLAALALALASDRVLRWPRAPALAAAAVVGGHLVDLAFGSPLIVRSLAGPNPTLGARFFGVGNELAAILAMTVLIGTGAALAARRGRAVPAGFALACLVVALFVGAGRLGADVGGVMMLAAGGAAAVVAGLPGGPSRRSVVLALVVPALALAGLVALDLATGGDAHLSRSVLDADSPGELRDVAERRFTISWQSLRSGTTPASVGLFALLLAWGLARRRRVLAPLGGDRAFAAGIWGALAATLVGALANDSGPTIFLVGAVTLLLTAAYLAGKPPAGGLS